MKKNILLFIVISLFLIGCNNDEKNNDKLENNEKIFKENVNKIIEIVNNNNIKNNDLKYNNYFIENNMLYDKNELNINIDVSDYEFNYGKIVTNDNNELYIFVENANYCAVKSFKDDDISVYNINEAKKCHIPEIYYDELTLYTFGYIYETEQVYLPENISKYSVSISAISSLIDSKAATYQWYRNGEKIENSNYETHTITENEDAEYYVELTTTDGKTVKSEPFHVIIQK